MNGGKVKTQSARLPFDRIGSHRKSVSSFIITINKAMPVDFGMHLISVPWRHGF
jgi:hypothetical protein